jgi:hypothetical protein
MLDYLIRHQDLTNIQYALISNAYGPQHEKAVETTIPKWASAIMNPQIEHFLLYKQGTQAHVQPVSASLLFMMSGAKGEILKLASVNNTCWGSVCSQVLLCFLVSSSTDSLTHRSTKSTGDLGGQKPRPLEQVPVVQWPQGCKPSPTPEPRT